MGAVSIKATLPVFLALLIIRSSSSGETERKLTTSVEIPNSSRIAATFNASKTPNESAAKVKSVGELDLL